MLDLSALMLFDPATGKTEMVESDPLKRVDFGQGGFRGGLTNWCSQHTTTTKCAAIQRQKL